MVTTFDSIPVAKAFIYISSSKLVVQTDSLGHFKLECKVPDKLKISADGFLSQKFKVETTTKPIKINLKLKSGNKARKLAINSGHVHDEEKLKIAVSLGNTVDYSRYESALEIIKNKYPGVQIRQDEIIIRGISSLTGSNAALIEIDGQILDFNALVSVPTATIVSVKIINSSSAGMYGSRGANGVVVVKTKKATRR